LLFSFYMDNPVEMICKARSIPPEVSMGRATLELPTATHPDRHQLAGLPEQFRSQHSFSSQEVPDGLSLQLVRIWEQALDGQRIKPTDDFFALGGDSLAAAVIVAAVEKYLGISLPVSALIEAPTVAKLAELIWAGGSPDSRLRLVALRDRGTKPPLYCIPVRGKRGSNFTNWQPRSAMISRFLLSNPRGSTAVRRFCAQSRKWLRITSLHYVSISQAGRIFSVAARLAVWLRWKWPNA
jgi:acyl carrier protein